MPEWTRPQSKAPLQILLVEDDASDARIIRKVAHERFAGRIHITVVQNGEEALQFLRRQSPYVDAPIPSLVILDLNMPKKNGREVLAEMKADQNLNRIPVVILSTSSPQPNLLEQYGLPSSAFITKAAELNEFQRAIEQLFEERACARPFSFPARN
ncbi:MAG: response regulator [Deltaproteobacteria bacterium]|nr:response regulator [Deltaproteobacteria bacterium]